MDGLTESFYPWSTAIFITDLIEHKALQPDVWQVVRTLSARQSQSVESGIAPRAKYNMLESPLDFLDYTDRCGSVNQLKQALTQLLAMVIAEVNQNSWAENSRTRTVITESWYHLTRRGGYHDVHSHPNCSWCGIYCLQAPETGLEENSTGGINRFYDPRVNADQYKDAGNLYIGDEGFWDIALRAGQVVIFPSYIKHSALPYYGDTDRVVIAFNSQTEFICD